MDVSRPSAAVVPTLDGPVLQVLARTRAALTGRQVHALAAAGSEAGVRKVLARLVRHGIVRATEAGRAMLYTANRDHIAWPAVQLLAELRTELLDRFQSELRSWTVPPVTAALFGSAARGDGDPDSDIDLLLVRPDSNDETWAEQVDTIREHVRAWTGNRCQVYDINVAELGEHARSAEPIIASWSTDAVLLHGDPLSRVLDSQPPDCGR